MNKNSPVQKIKERLSIEDVVSSYIKLERAGSNLKARCPFHNEKTPSFFISPDRGSYYCFGCGAKGDIFSFVEEFEGLDFKGALKLLAQKAGVVLEKFDSREESEKERLHRIMEESAKFYSFNLKNSIEAKDYLLSRGLTENSILNFEIGFAKDDWRDLYNYLKSKKFSDREIELAGLIKKTEKGYYDRFRNRLMFPISDSSGRIIAFSGRIFVDDGKSAKYLNSPETPIFSKSFVLYGLDKAKDSIRKNNFSILVEGQFDLVLSHQAGFRNTVATSGTALADSTMSKENLVSNLGLIRRLSQNIVLAFDADKAGLNASIRASKIALSFDMDVKVASMPEGVDPADLISKNGIDAWRESIKNSKHIIEFLLTKVLSGDIKDSRLIGRKIKENILPYISVINSAIEKAHFVKLISDKSGINEEAIKEDLKKVEQELRFENIEVNNIKEKKEETFRKDYIERKLLGIIFWQESIENSVLDYADLLNRFINITKKGKDFIDKEKINKEDLIFEAEVFYQNDNDLKKDTEELLSNLEEEYLREKLADNIRILKNYDMEGDNEKSKKILEEINEINNKIQNIKNSRLSKKL